MFINCRKPHPALMLVGLGLGFHSIATSANVEAFVGGRIFDGTRGAVVEKGTLVVTDGRVTAVGPSDKVKPPKGAQTFDVAGKTIVPGFVNSHAHVSDVYSTNAGAYTDENVDRQLRLFARYGITTIFSLGGEEAPAFKARDSQSTPSLDRARIFVAGKVIVGKTPEDARRMVDQVADTKPNYIKIRVDDNLGTSQKITPDVYRAVIDEAHKRGFRLFVHMYYLDDAKDLLRAGADFIAHSVRDKEVDDEFVSLMKQRNICYTPTLTREISTFIYQDTPSFFQDPFFLKEADPKVLGQLKDPKYQENMRKSKQAQAYQAALPTAERNLKKLSDAGVPIALGTDSGATANRFEGYFEHVEMQMMAESGMSPQKILLAATGDSARCMQANDIGTLEPGKWADFLVMQKNPLDDIHNTKTLESVWIAGNQVKR